MEKFFLKIIVENQKGVMARISALLSRKGYHLKSASVGKHINEDEASILVVVTGEEAEVENAKNMLDKMINVISIEMFSQDDVIETEHCLVKIKKASGVEEIISPHNGKILLEKEDYLIFEISDKPEKIDEFISKAKKEFEVVDISRSGTNALSIK